MLNWYGAQRRFCDNINRRDFFTIGATGIAGLSLPNLLRAEALAGAKATGKSIINIYLAGGPTHLDTFDLKPKAPKEFRGEFSPIATKASGVEICELFPNLASHGDKIAIVRSLVDLKNEHSATQSDSGWSTRAMKEQGGRPGLGAVMSKLYGPAVTTADGTAPMAMDLTGWTRPGFLGQTHSAYRPDGTGKANLKLNTRIKEDRFQERSELLGQFDRYRRQADASGMMDAMDSFSQRAFGLITSGQVAKAIDLNEEAEETVDRYGAKKDRDAKNFLMARRLIDTGVRNVAFSIGGWDTHGKNFDAMRKKLPVMDVAMSAMIEDLHNSGRLEDTIIMMSGEFGRTPRINKNAGRDHWPSAGFFFLCGGGLNTGQVIGSTNRLGERPEDRPVHLQEVFATVYRQLGIDCQQPLLQDNNGRPQFLVDHRQVIEELV
ncbi:DUF1501 domain-containing protein [Planctomicrobium sp.]|jgi:hypothetical protein|nr:DUF1501 domain-containing protein [Planctomicrobium sp.]MBT5019307.1 DUF1501 domain-containing protein [Planctomicrobium sp.]MDA7503539.1 DUF1501 domain-containing protein [bacterium]MDB4743402.1 DUF1501 domain-containing protein [Planctomicrobium sp.]